MIDHLDQPFSTYLATLERLRAIFLAAMEDFEGGYLQSTRSLVQAEVFDTELEQASELLKGGYKLPAAVVAGVVLETTLRELCKRENIAHGKLDKMNLDLCKKTFTTCYNRSELLHLLVFEILLRMVILTNLPTEMLKT